MTKPKSWEDYLGLLQDGWGVVGYSDRSHLYKHLRTGPEWPPATQIPFPKTVINTLVKKGLIRYINNGIYRLTTEGTAQDIPGGDERK